MKPEHVLGLLITLASGRQLAIAQQVLPADCQQDELTSCCNPTVVTINCADGTTSCTIYFETCNAQYNCTPAQVGRVAEAYTCTKVAVQSKCVRQADGSYVCEEEERTVEYHAGCMATGDPCPGEMKADNI